MTSAISSVRRLAAATFAVVLGLSTYPRCSGFASVGFSNRRGPLVTHSAKKSGGKGFGKAPAAPPQKTESPPVQSTPVSPREGGNDGGGLQSIEGSEVRPQINIDPNLPEDERAEQILRQKFGLRSYEEQQGDLKAVIRAEQKKEKRNKLRKIEELWPENKDVFAMIPAPILIFIDGFLKLGLGVSTVLFVAAGIGITAEAWAVATGNKLPENIDNFIVNVVEPNFTPGLLVLLTFSVSLGVFASAQLGSESSQYQEKP